MIPKSVAPGRLVVKTTKSPHDAALISKENFAGNALGGMEAATVGREALTPSEVLQSRRNAGVRPRCLRTGGRQGIRDSAFASGAPVSATRAGAFRRSHCCWYRRSFLTREACAAVRGFENTRWRLLQSQIMGVFVRRDSCPDNPRAVRTAARTAIARRLIAKCFCTIALLPPTGDNLLPDFQLFPGSLAWDTQMRMHLTPETPVRT